MQKRPKENFKFFGENFFFQKVVKNDEKMILNDFGGNFFFPQKKILYSVKGGPKENFENSEQKRFFAQTSCKSIFSSF